MNRRAIVLLLLLLVSFAYGEPEPDFKGLGEWGNETAGLACRITVAKTDYRIGKPVPVLVEVRNLSDKAIVLYAELSLKTSSSSQAPVETTQINFSFTQKDRKFSQSQTRPFPTGDKTKTQSIVIAPGAIFSGIIPVSPWGPTWGSITSEAGPGPMVLTGSLIYYLSRDHKTKTIESKPITIMVQPAEK